MSIMTQMFPGA